MRYPYLSHGRKPWHRELLSKDRQQSLKVLEALDELDKTPGRTLKDRLTVLNNQTYNALPWNSYESYSQYINYEYLSSRIRKALNYATV